MRVAAVVCLALSLAVACQPSGGPGAAGTPPPSERSTRRPLGAPAAGLPSDLGELLDRGLKIAEEWQAEPVLAEVEVDIDRGRWTDARLLYVAADSDRYLQLVATGSGFTQERITLSTLQVEAIPPEAVEQIPEFPEDTVPPAELVTSEVVAACGVAGVASVFYVTGAPVAWTGTEWSPQPQWRATVTAPEGAGATVGVDGAEVECLG